MRSAAEPASPPIAGRAREQAELRGLLDEALPGNGRVVLISGEAGIGKTTLVRDAAREAASRGALVLTGGCYVLTTTPPYGPWLEMRRDYQRRRELDSSPSDLPPLPNVFTGSDGPAGVRSQQTLFEEFTRFLAGTAATRPLLLVLEDMHWTDPASTDLLRVVARSAGTLPALLLVTYRAEEVPRESRLYEVLPQVVREAEAARINLRPLDRPAIESLVAGLYPTGADDRHRLVDYLERYAAGNPFYIRELLQSLEDTGILAPTEDGWDAGDLSRLVVPELLQQMIDARLARLDDPVQHGLKVAAVIGHEVPLDAWQAVLGMSSGETLDLVDAGAQAQLVEASPDGMSINFRHALIREAIYQSIPPPRRRILHREIGDRLVEAGDPDPDVAARHLQMAGDDRAVEWLIRASERAQRAYAWTSAAERLIAALDLLPESAPARDRGWLKYRAGRLLRHANPPEAMRWLREAEQLGAWASDRVLTAYARFDLGHIRVLGGDYRRGLAEMLDGDALLDNLPADHAPPGSDVAAWIADTLPLIPDQDREATPQTTAPRANPRRGTLVQWLVEPGRFEEARALGEPYVEEIGNPPPGNEQIISSAGDAWFGLGRVYAAYRQPEDARRAFNSAIECYRLIEHHMLVSATYRTSLLEASIPFWTADAAQRETLASLSSEALRHATGALPSDLPAELAAPEVLCLNGRWDAALRYLQFTAAPGTTIEPRRQQAVAWVARLTCERGDTAASWDCVRDILPDGPDTQPGNVSYSAAIMVQLAAIKLAFETGDTPLASAWIESLDRWLAWSEATLWDGEASLMRARYQQATGDTTSARSLVQTALEQARDPDMPLVQIAALRLLGEIDAGSDHHAAEQHLSESLALAEACAVPYERALSLLVLAELRRAGGDATEATDLAREAGSIFEQLGAKPALERARKLEATLDGAARQAAPFNLSPREIEVLRLVVEGLTDAEVAGELSISYRTVTTHLTSIYTKLGVNSRVSATRLAVEHGIV